jgi:integrase
MLARASTGFHTRVGDSSWDTIMARKIRDAKLESRTARLRLPVQKKPFTGPALARGIHLLYRRNKGNGTWIAKASNGHGGYWTKGFAVADDFEDADATHVLTFHEACDAAKALARGKADAHHGDKPMTVGDALAAYKRDLTSRGGHLGNATRVEKHLTGALAGKPVGMLTARDLKTWRDGLIDKMEASSVNRTRTGLRAALELAATLDHRITNRHVFRLGLRGLPGSNKARRIVLPDADVLSIVRAAQAIDGPFGLLVETLAVTGARLSQAARLTCGDLQADRPDPRLMMPSSFKGAQKKITHRPVPITPALAAALKKATSDRPGDAPLLLKRDGSAWQATNTSDHRDLFRRAVERAGLNPDQITSYALRHSSIVRALLGGVPVAVVAQQHDTSVREIEAHYGKFILDFSDAISRRVLLDTASPVAGDNVVPLPRVARE